ncbi:hypothetical protein PHYPO_G00121000 [Pangasianodon hypophthalmus]|uniref:Uncharacterized protein n=1 Tax=Pangasianodon hypophthalmus TaxID=310915 RepID=A0A5N5KZS4_PANHP|nr:hypothetical protein PHYPO_G00121000 [Pangasianodon hypophthalmus]
MPNKESPARRARRSPAGLEEMRTQIRLGRWATEQPHQLVRSGLFYVHHSILRYGWQLSALLRATVGHMRTFAARYCRKKAPRVFVALRIGFWARKDREV